MAVRQDDMPDPSRRQRGNVGLDAAGLGQRGAGIDQ